MKFSHRIIFTLVVAVVVLLVYRWQMAVSVLHRKSNRSTNIKYSPNISDDRSYQIIKSRISISQTDSRSNCDKIAWPNVTLSDLDTSILIRETDFDHVSFGKDQKNDQVPKPVNGHLKVIVIPHSHSDPGWLMTLQGHFALQTSATLNNMIEKMTKYPNMTFVWAESVFLSMWWNTLKSSQKEKARNLVKSKRLEIVVGSWVVPDEANPHLYALVDQMITGHDWLLTNLGTKPNNSWSLDPFGYSNTLPYLYEKAGFHNLVILRIHKDLKVSLQNHKAMNFRWRQRYSDDSGIRTHLMPYKLYNIKHSCGPVTSVCLKFDFRRIPGEGSESRSTPVTNDNVAALSRELVDQYRRKAALYKERVVLIPLGDDFRYDRPVEWDQQYENYMKLFSHINQNPDLNTEIKFGTVQDYFNTLDQELHTMEMPTLAGDFFPYTDEKEEYWTGYYTSRPFYKAVGRSLETFLHAADALSVFAIPKLINSMQNQKIIEETRKSLKFAHESLGLFQHHDAITGTARDEVVLDYQSRLESSFEEVRNVIGKTSSILLGNNINISHVETASIFLNQGNPHKILDARQNPSVVIYNSLGVERLAIVRVHVNIPRIMVQSITSKNCQVNPIFEGHKISLKSFELIFLVSLKPLSLHSFMVSQASNHTKCPLSKIKFHNLDEVPPLAPFSSLPKGAGDIKVEMPYFTAFLCPRDGLLKNIKFNKQKWQLHVDFLSYKSQYSGAYIFAPKEKPEKIVTSSYVIREVQGLLLSEITTFHGNFIHTSSYVKSASFLSNAVHLRTWTDIRGKEDFELALRVDTDVESSDHFTTDLNGHSFVKRQRFHNLTEAANFYPMSSALWIEDDNKRVSILGRQPLGCTSNGLGGMEVMLDRRLSNDDGRGLGQGVMDNLPVLSEFFLLLELKVQKNSSNTSDHLAPSLDSSFLSQMLQNHPIIMHATNLQVPVSWSALRYAFPCHIQILNLRFYQWHPQSKAVPPAALVLLHRPVSLRSLSSQAIPSCRCSSISDRDAVGHVDLWDVWGSSPLSVKDASLSMLHVRQNISLPVYLHPLEIKSFSIEWNAN